MALSSTSSQRFHDTWSGIFSRQLKLTGATVEFDAIVDLDPPISAAGTHTPIASEEELIAGGFEGQKRGYVALHRDSLVGAAADEGNQIRVAGVTYLIIRRQEEPEAEGDREVKLWIQAENER